MSKTVDEVTSGPPAAKYGNEAGGSSTDAGMLPFTSHNIELADGTQTMPGQELHADRLITKAIMRTLRLCFPDIGETKPSVVDLACLEGGYSAVFAAAGFEVLGIEGRSNNYDRCQLVARDLGLENLRFVCDDVRNLEKYGVFDATFCSGILYHLDNPVSFLEVVSRCTRKVLILQTHFATDQVPALYELSEMTEHEGVMGRWYLEHEDLTTDEEKLARRWTALDNNRAFWIEKRHLLQALRRVGFGIVYEQFDFLTDVVTDTEDKGRSLFIAVKQD